MKHLYLFAALSLSLLGSASIARADTLTFYNTGVDNNGNLLTSGTADSHYNLIYSADSNGNTAMATTPNPAWESNSSTAGWISPGSSGNQSWSTGYYVYEQTLDLTGYDPTSAILSGMVAADDQIYIFLNRQQPILFSSSGYNSSTAFLLNSGWVSGLNYVDFVVSNSGGGPTGLMVDDTQATANAVTPEPGSLLLLATGGVFGLHLLRRARQQAL